MARATKEWLLYDLLCPYVFVERVHPYQRRRTSITGLRLYPKLINEQGG
jgi:hypothetical protein